MLVSKKKGHQVGKLKKQTLPDQIGLIQSVSDS